MTFALYSSVRLCCIALYLLCCSSAHLWTSAFANQFAYSSFIDSFIHHFHSMTFAIFQYFRFDILNIYMEKQTNTTTTTRQRADQLNKLWNDLDFSPLCRAVCIYHQPKNCHLPQKCVIHAPMPILVFQKYLLKISTRIIKWVQSHKYMQ